VLTTVVDDVEELLGFLYDSLSISTDCHWQLTWVLVGGSILPDMDVIVHSGQARGMASLERILRKMPAFVIEQTVRVSSPCYTLHEYPIIG
jgi:hypothetical protein